MNPKRKFRPLTRRQQQLVEDFARQWRPVAMARTLARGAYFTALDLGVDPNEIERELWVAVCKATKTYDPRKASFATYAGWKIRSTMTKIVYRATSPTWNPRVPVIGGLYMRNHEAEIFAESSDDPADLAERADTEAYLRNEVADALRRLDKRSRRIIERRFGLNGQKQQAARKVGRVFKISNQRVRQLEQAALERIAGKLQTTCGNLV